MHSSSSHGPLLILVFSLPPTIMVSHLRIPEFSNDLQLQFEGNFSADFFLRAAKGYEIAQAGKDNIDDK